MYFSRGYNLFSTKDSLQHILKDTIKDTLKQTLKRTIFFAATVRGVRISIVPSMGGFAKSTSLVKHCGQADPQRQHFRAAGWSQKIASMIALAMFILMPFCNVTTVPPERLKLSKHWYIAAWKNRRLALVNATARFNFAFLGAIRIGGNAPNEALAAEVSRARSLKKAPTPNEEGYYYFFNGCNDQLPQFETVSSLVFFVFGSGQVIFWYLWRLNCRFRTGVYIVNPGRKRQIECSALILIKTRRCFIA